MLYFYLKMHQNAFGRRVPPGPVRELTARPLAPLKLEGWWQGKSEGGERERKERRRTSQCLKCVDAPAGRPILLSRQHK